MARIRMIVLCCMLSSTVFAGYDWQLLIEKTSEMKGYVLSLVAVDKDSESVISLRGLYEDKLCNPTTYSFVDTDAYGDTIPTDDQISDELAIYCLKRGYFGGLFKIKLNATGEVIGFILVDEPREDSYIHFYRHIFPQFRTLGYGTKALNLLTRNLESISKYLIPMPEGLKDERFMNAMELIKKSILLHEKNVETKKSLIENIPTRRDQEEIEKFIEFALNICSNKIIWRIVISTIAERQIWLFEPQRIPLGLLSTPQPFDNPASRRSLEKAGFKLKDRNAVFPFSETPSYIK